MGVFPYQETGHKTFIRMNQILKVKLAQVESLFRRIDTVDQCRIYIFKYFIGFFKDIHIHDLICDISVLARYNPFTHSICRVMKGKNYGIEPRNAEQSFAFEILNDPNVKLVTFDYIQVVEQRLHVRSHFFLCVSRKETDILIRKCR